MIKVKHHSKGLAIKNLYQKAFDKSVRRAPDALPLYFDSLNFSVISKSPCRELYP